jgi:hypothetical protein
MGGRSLSEEVDPLTDIRVGDKVMLRGSNLQNIGDVEVVYPICGGWPSSGAADIRFDAAWIPLVLLAPTSHNTQFHEGDYALVSRLWHREQRP